MITKIDHDEDDNIYDQDEDYDANDDLVVKASSSILAPVVSSCSARTRIKPVTDFFCFCSFFSREPALLDLESQCNTGLSLGLDH